MKKESKGESSDAKDRVVAIWNSSNSNGRREEKKINTLIFLVPPRSMVRPSWGWRPKFWQLRTQQAWAKSGIEKQQKSLIVEKAKGSL